jgi:hypothetical protein
MYFQQNFISSSVNVSVDPVDVPGDLSVNTRVGSHGAGFDGPGHNSDLLAVDIQGTAGVILNFRNIQ